MNDDDLDRLLLAETRGVEPSPTFAAEVMAAAHRYAATPPPLPFPWKWLVLCLGASMVAIPGVLSVADRELLESVVRDEAFGSVPTLIDVAVTWVPAMVLVTLGAVAASVRSLRATI